MRKAGTDLLNGISKIKLRRAERGPWSWSPLSSIGWHNAVKLPVKA